MPSTRDIRRRIRSVGSTAQITKAMQMVAASKMRKAQEAALAGRPFVYLLYRIQREATTRLGDLQGPAAGGRGVPNRRVILGPPRKGFGGPSKNHPFPPPTQIPPGREVFKTRRKKARAFGCRSPP